MGRARTQAWDLASDLVGRVGALRWSLGAAVVAGVDLVLPPQCPVCRRPTGGRGLCPGCWHGVRFIERPWCDRLGLPLPYDLGPGTLSAAAIADPPAFGRARSAVVYDGPIPDLVQALKYGDRADLVPMMAAWMARAGADLLAETDMLVPIPLHRARLFRRRFNQAALLSRALARSAGIAHRPLLLTRARRTRSQIGLSREGRAANVAGAFKVPPAMRPAVEGARILLIDDVLTTGATLEAAARPLLRAGAATVDVLTLARVVAMG